jgi:hypothetical protein
VSIDQIPISDRSPTLKQRFLKLFLLFTAPGVALHEVAHELICISQRIPIGDVVYFQLGSPAGYVQHGQPRSWTQAFLLAVAPLFINIFIAGWFYTFAFTVISGGPKMIALGIVLIWLAFAATVHSLPSPQDIKNLWNYTTAHFIRYPLLILVAPLYGIILLVHKFGMYYVSVPLAIAVFIGMGVLFQIDPGAMSDCVLAGQWGCWDYRSVLDMMLSKS